jgi:hypothetical protein
LHQSSACLRLSVRACSLWCRPFQQWMIAL